MPDRNFKGSPRRALTGATIGFFTGFASVALFGPTARILDVAMDLSPVAVGFLVAMPNLSGSLLRIPFAAWADAAGGRKPFLVLFLLSIVGMGGLTALMFALPMERASASSAREASRHDEHDDEDDHDGEKENGEGKHEEEEDDDDDHDDDEVESAGFIPKESRTVIYALLLVLGLLCGCGIATFSVGVGQVSCWYTKAAQGRALAAYAGLGNLAPGLFSLLVPAAIAAAGLSGAYLAWFLFLIAGTLVYARLTDNSWYFQARAAGADPATARAEAAARGQEIFPTGTVKQSLVTAARVWRTWALLIVYFTTFGGFLAITVWSPTYWTGAFGKSLPAAGALTAAFAILSSLVRVAGGIMADKLKEGGENTAILAVLVTLVASILMTTTRQFEIAVPGILLLAIGMGMTNAAVFRMLPEAVPQAVGGAAGWIGGLGALGGFIVPPILAFAVERHGIDGYPLGFITFVFLSLVSLTLVWILKYTR